MFKARLNGLDLSKFPVLLQLVFMCCVILVFLHYFRVQVSGSL